MLNLVGVAASACILNGSSSSCMLFPFHIPCNRTPIIWPRGVSVHATFSLKGCHYSLSSHKFHLFKIKSQHCESNPHDSSAFSFTQSETNNNSGSRSSDDNGISNKSTISSSSGHGDGDDDAKEPTSKKQQNNSWKMPQWNWNWNWNWKRGGHGLIQIWGLAFQLSLLFLFMKLLRPGLTILASRKPQTPLIDTSGVPAARVNVSFSEFLQRIKRNHVQRVEIDGVHFTFSLRPDAEEGVDQGLEIQNPLIDHKGDLLALAQLGHLVPLTRKTIYTTTKPSDITTPYDKMIQDGVEFGAPDKRSGRLISSISLALLYVVLVVGLLVHLPFKFPQLTGHFHRRNRKGGNSKQSTCLVTFADVAGVDEAKEELEEIVEYLRTPDRFSRLGARPPRGVLLVGLPGTGKTLLAKAVAGEADVPFLSCSASEFVELYVGMGASRVRDLFIKAKKDAPSIVFIDEIDAVAKGRDGRLRSVSNDEREQTLNQLLTELDGFESNSTVIVLAATNRADVLDPALRRPGRFDRIVTVDPPDRRGREEILQVHAVKKQVPLASDVDLGQVAAVTSGFTGADLANLVNEAALLAGRAGKSEVHKEEFTSAIERSIAGIEKKRSTLHGNEKGVVARHEAGHAVVGTAIATLLPSHVHIEKLSILPRSGGTLGFTYVSSGNEDRYLLFVDEIRGRLVTLLGGRAAEEVIYCGRVSTGALDDIKQATDVAYKAVAEYGLSSCIGPISLATLSGGGLDDSGVAFPRTKDQGHVTDLVQREVRALLLSAFEMALLVIRSNPTVLEGLGAQLEAEEKVEGERLQDWLNNVVAPAELAAFIKGDARLF